MTIVKHHRLNALGTIVAGDIRYVLVDGSYVAYLGSNSGSAIPPAVLAHSHAISDITGLQTALDGKAASFTTGDIVQGTGVSISGTLTNRLVGSGNITISANLSGYATESWVSTNYAAKSTSLSGYGITNAYTKTEVLDGFVSSTPSTSDWNTLHSGNKAIFVNSIINAPTSITYFGLSVANTAGTGGVNLAFRNNAGYFRTIESGVIGGWLKLATEVWVGSQSFATQSWVNTNLTIDKVLSNGNIATGKQMFLNGVSASNAAILTVAADGGYFNFRNGAALAGVFIPTMEAFANGTSSSGFSLVVRGSDTYSTGGLVATIQNAAGSGGVASGNLFTVRNGSTVSLSVNYQGNVTANAYIKSGGTPSQFLKADGSVDSNSYVSSSGTKTVNRLTMWDASGNLVNSNFTQDTNRLILGFDSNNQSKTVYFNATDDYVKFQVSNWTTLSSIGSHAAIYTASAGGSEGSGRLTIVSRPTDDANGRIDFRTGLSRNLAAFFNYDGQFTSYRRITVLESGSSPFDVASTSLNVNLNADLLDGFHASSFAQASALASYTPTSRSLTGTSSITGGGDFTTNRSFSLVNDNGSPGNNRYYGTNASGSKGWHSLPSGGSGTVTWVGLLVPTGFTVLSTPVTGAGSLEFGFASGYSLPTTANQNSWTAKIGGSGTTNRIAMFTGSNSIGNSPIYQNGDNIGIGTSPSHKFQVAGNAYIGGDLFTTGTISSSNKVAVSNGFTTINGGFYSGSGLMHSSAIAQFDSTSKGVLFPSMTTAQMNAISSPASGLVIYNNELGYLMMQIPFAGWKKIAIE